VESYDTSNPNILEAAVNNIHNDENRALIVDSPVTSETLEEPKDIEPKRSFWSRFKQTVKIIKFDSKKFTSQLNEEVTRLGLYFSILLGEFNIILNVSQMTIIEKGSLALLQTNNNDVKASLDFKKLLISSIIYRTLQIHNIFSLCTPTGLISDASKEITCSEDKIQQYTNEIETERLQIRKILFGKRTFDKTPLFPLYHQYQNNTELKILRDIMKVFKDNIESEEEAREFAKTLHDFNQEISKDFNEKYSGKKSNSSPGSTKSDDTSQLGVNYEEDENDEEN
jgi:hypothetical protein